MLAITDDPSQTNILIDRDSNPRLTGYGLIPIVPEPTMNSPGNTGGPVNSRTYECVAPELLNPSGFGLKNDNTTQSSDIYAFGMTTYQVDDPCFFSGTVTNAASR